jgi:peptidoglycan/LPS O-acetylase OafA/YrhL
MSVHESRQPRLGARRQPSVTGDELVTAGIAVLAAYSILLALFMAIAPHAFYSAVGPFGARNDHYIRDTATFSAAIGVGLAVAVRRAAWRVPMLAVAAIQFALHSVNHLVDISRAHPAWTGYFDFFSLTLSTVLIIGLLRLAAAEESAERLRWRPRVKGAQR